MQIGTRRHQRLKNRRKKLWNWLTEATTFTQDEEKRQHSRLLAGLLTTILPLGIVLGTSRALMRSGASIVNESDLLALASGAMGWAAAFILNRIGHYTRAAVLAVSAASFAIFIPVVTEGDPTAAPFALLPILLSSMLLPIRFTALYGALNLVPPLLFPLVIAEATYADVVVWIGFVIIGSALTLLAAGHREGLEKCRQVEAEAREKKLSRHHRELLTLYEASTTISSNLSLDVVLITVAEHMARAVSSSGCTLSLWDRRRNRVKTLVDYGTNWPEGTELPLEEYDLDGFPATRRVLETCQPTVVQSDDPAADEAELALMEEYGGKSLLILPLIARDRVLGLVELSDDVQRREFTPSHIRLAQSLASQAAIAIENAQLYAESQRQVQELSGMYDTALAISGALEKELLLKRVHAQVQHLLAPDTFVVVLYDDDAEGFQVVLAEEEGETVPGVVGLNLSLEEGGFTGYVLREREALLVKDVEQDSLPIKPLHGARPARSWLGVPLIARDQLIGALSVQSFQPNTFDKFDRRFLESLAAQIASALENARLVEALRQHALELETRNEDLDAFAHTVAHDLKDPLARIIGFAELLDDGAPLSDQERRLSLHTIARNARKMSNITDELLLLAGVRQVKKIEFTPVAMAEVAAAALDRLADMVEECGAEVTLPAQWPTALGYGPWIEEVWVNYISNAIKYGGRPPELELGATVEDDGMVRFWVRDNGFGLSTAEQAHVFKPLTRLDQVRAKGYGLGLSIARRIVTKLGGQVGVESEIGVGSLFSFTLSQADSQHITQEKHAEQ